MHVRPLAALTAALLLVAGCTGSPEPTATSAAPSTSSSASPTAEPTPAITVSGADAALTAAVGKVYAGRTGVSAKATLGTWGKEKVAVVTAGDDVTLAVGPSWRVVGGWWPSLDKAPSLGKGPRFVLVMGCDAKGSSFSGARGDTLQVVALDGKGGGGVVGIPRDLWVPLSTGGTSKINAAFAYGGGDAAGQDHREAQRPADRGVRRHRLLRHAQDRRRVRRAAADHREELHLPRAARRQEGQAGRRRRHGARLRARAARLRERRLRPLEAPAGDPPGRGGRGPAQGPGGAAAGDVGDLEARADRPVGRGRPDLPRRLLPARPRRRSGTRSCRARSARAATGSRSSRSPRRRWRPSGSWPTAGC